MAKLANHIEKIAEGVTGGYQKIEDSIAGAYKKVESAFVDTFLPQNPIKNGQPDGWPMIMP